MNSTGDSEGTNLSGGPTYRNRMITSWNVDRRGMVELDAVARAYLGDEEITDRDRIAFALRELRRRGYNVEADPVDWNKGKMICSLDDSLRTAFGLPQRSVRYARLDRIAKRTRLVVDEMALEHLVVELYDAAMVWDRNLSDCLAEPYEFTFKGDPELVDAVFQAVGFVTRLGVDVPDDGSESNHFILVAPPTVCPQSGPV